MLCIGIITYLLREKSLVLEKIIKMMATRFNSVY